MNSPESDEYPGSLQIMCTRRNSDTPIWKTMKNEKRQVPKRKVRRRVIFTGLILNNPTNIEF